MPTISPRCHRAIGETPWCALCRAHNDPHVPCYCPECDPDAYNDDEAIAEYEAQLTEAQAMHEAQLAGEDPAERAAQREFDDYAQI